MVCFPGQPIGLCPCGHLGRRTRTSTVSVGKSQFGGFFGIVIRVIESRARRDLYVRRAGVASWEGWESSDDDVAAKRAAFSISSKRVKENRSLRDASAPATLLQSQFWPLLTRTNVYFMGWWYSSMSSTNLVSMGNARLRYPPVISMPGFVCTSDHGFFFMGGIAAQGIARKRAKRKTLEPNSTRYFTSTRYVPSSENILSLVQDIFRAAKMSCHYDKIFLCAILRPALHFYVFEVGAPGGGAPKEASLRC